MWSLIISQITSRPLMAIMLGQVFFWSLWPAFLFSTPPLDVVENMFWGPQWEWGYYKHPPLQAWLTQLAVMLGGPWVVYVMAQLCITTTYAGIYWAGVILHGRALGIWAVVLSALGFYATIASVEFNANVVSMPFWSLSMALGLLLTKCHDRWPWYGLAITFACALLAKYVALFLALTLFLLLLIAPSSRRALATPHPYLALGLAFLLLSPHFFWLWENEFAPIIYAQERASLMQGWEVLARPLKFILAQLLDFILPILVCLPAILFAKRRETHRPGPGWKSLFVALGPILLLAAYAVITKGAPKDMWGGPATILATLPLAHYLQQHQKWPLKKTAAYGVALVMLILPLGLGLASKASSFTDRPMRTAWPSQNMTNQILEELGPEQAKKITHLVGATWDMGIIFIHWPYDVLPVVHGDLNINPWARESWHNGTKLYLWTGQDNAYAGKLSFAASGKILYQSKNSNGLSWGIASNSALGKNP